MEKAFIDFWAAKKKKRLRSFCELLVMLRPLKSFRKFSKHIKKQWKKREKLLKNMLQHFGTWIVFMKFETFKILIFANNLKKMYSIIAA